MSSPSHVESLQTRASTAWKLAWMPAWVLVLASLASGGCGSDSGSGDKDGAERDGAAMADRMEPDGRGDAETDGEGPGTCKGGLWQCIDDRTVQECQGGAWVTVSVCDQNHFCAQGTCVELKDCTPGVIQGCFSYFQQAICNPEGRGFVPMDCPTTEICVDGMCQEYECMPGAAQCLDSATRQICDESGHWGPGEACQTGACLGGKCISACMTDPKWANSSVGCEYWTVDLDQGDMATLMSGGIPPAEAPHSVVLSNPGTEEALVTFTTLMQDIAVPWSTETIGPGQTREFEMPRMDLDGAGIFDRSIRISSTRPLVAVQFNPKDMASTYSNDSSLLIPAEMLGKEYLVLNWQSQMKTMGPYPPTHGYFTIVATEPGETSVTVTLASPSFGIIPNSPELSAGTPHEFKLQQFQVLQLEGESKTINFENDLSGSHVVADKRIAVFSGHEGPLICPEESHILCPVIIDPPPDASECSCCLEHLEEQLIPLSAWSSEYLVVKAAPRGDVDFDTYRVQAGADGISLTTDPAVDGANGKTLAKKGDWLEFASDQSFRISATGPIQVAQYIASMECVSDMTGDPAMIMMIGTGQFRTTYPFLVPQNYDEDWLAMVRPTGTTTTLDGTPLDANWAAVGTTGFEVAYVRVSSGPHLVESTAPFGAYQYGYFEATSYGNPAGMGL